MGFKLKRKVAIAVLPENRVSILLQKSSQKIEQFASLLGESEKSKPILYAALLCLVCALISLAYLFYNVPRHNQLIRSLGELRLLSQTISKQATEATESGSQEAITKATAI